MTVGTGAWVKKYRSRARKERVMANPEQDSGSLEAIACGSDLLRAPTRSV